MKKNFKLVPRPGVVLTPNQIEYIEKAESVINKTFYKAPFQKTYRQILNTVAAGKMTEDEGKLAIQKLYEEFLGAAPGNPNSQLKVVINDKTIKELESND